MKENFIKLQLFGQDCPPLYNIEEIMDKVNEITKIDEQINELLIKREVKVENLKKAIAEANTTKN